MGTSHFLLNAALAAAAVGVDRLLGEPARFHPLVGFGRVAGAVEASLNNANASAHSQRVRGVLAWLVCVLPAGALFALFALPGLPAMAEACIAVAALWFALGARSLDEHAAAVATPLARGELDTARGALARMVTRDTAALDETGIARGAIESTLENGADAIFGALFWFALLGALGAILYRLANTLDAMWGYRTARYLHFGWAAARLDDVLNFLPARLTALSYALLGNARRALACWRAQAPAWSSPNAGPVMASGAGTLGVALGGAASYHGVSEARPPLGAGRAPQAEDIDRARALVRRSTWLWLILWVPLLCALSAWVRHA